MTTGCFHSPQVLCGHLRPRRLSQEPKAQSGVSRAPRNHCTRFARRPGLCAVSKPRPPPPAPAFGGPLRFCPAGGAGAHFALILTFVSRRRDPRLFLRWRFPAGGRGKERPDRVPRPVPCAVSAPRGVRGSDCSASRAARCTHRGTATQRGVRAAAATQGLASRAAPWVPSKGRAASPLLRA